MSSFEDLQSAANLLADDLVIALIGCTGSGKSNLIDTLTNQPRRRALSRLDSCTTQIQAVRLLNHKTYRDRIVFIDTPGWGGPCHSDTEVLQMISEWLRGASKTESRIKLAGILYLHRITDNRISESWTPYRNLGMFYELMGPGGVKRIAFLTTMWDCVEHSIGMERENDLQSDYWKVLLTNGAISNRFLNTPESAWPVINCILKKYTLEEAPSRGPTDILLEDNDVIIAVVGPTGSGKSTFINIATDSQVANVGHGLASCTSKINSVKLLMPKLTDGNVVFIDTPGFDEATIRSEAECLKLVADWLKTTYGKEMLLSGLLYFRRISDNRTRGLPVNSINIFEQLCGKYYIQNVILATTMWDNIDEEIGDAREVELKTGYWKPMFDRESTTCRFLRTRDSAISLLQPLIDVANQRCSTLRQQEVEAVRKKLPTTPAAQQLFSQVETFVRKREELLQQIRAEMNHVDENNSSSRPMQELHRLKKDMVPVVTELRKLIIKPQRRPWFK